MFRNSGFSAPIIVNLDFQQLFQHSAQHLKSWIENADNPNVVIYVYIEDLTISIDPNEIATRNIDNYIKSFFHLYSLLILLLFVNV